MNKRLGNSTVRHVVFGAIALAASALTMYMGLSPNSFGMAIFTFITVIVNVYAGRWIHFQSLKGGLLDLFRMSFLSFFFSSLAGVIVFARYVEPDQRFLHYLETWINVSAFTGLCLLFGFFAFRAGRKRESAI
ncbi:MAG: hypothetical protein J7619_01685 [Dyadobacter sp.]|uniref:hypothetical protein n=1 Tax=Dyadobacter sp. TaxID=1914288 RepID=UPI001B09BA6D|nr:hypothetical protein [Dyadobacter sp.]MBO9611372.1 hypothetical protein [Dyadobacter sp.]